MFTTGTLKADESAPRTPYAGTYSTEGITVELKKVEAFRDPFDGRIHYSCVGTLTIKDKEFTLDLTGDDADLIGEFKDGDAIFATKIAVKGDTLTLHSGKKDHILKRVNPLDK